MLSDQTEIVFYELPKLKQQVEDYLAGKVDIKTLSDDVKWCIYMKYRHEERATSFIEELCLKEDGIMKAEKTITRVDRDLRRYARAVAEMKDNVDRMFEHERVVKETKVEIARKMKSAGKPISEITEFIGIPEETIKTL